ncbi:nuclear transcription factor Y subunit gamma-like [Cucumis melo var. makuwa]|uniref:Nuclear transcription factor Y subunit gamma-like n=2 Tax=Cucumis melo TaxID=3656 RepID=A0A1S3BC71_CUCME|nr:uncharacterized protein LOC103488327 [Cucumis melo]KAA0064910.1 nuclear transcription factor Y subunit gamma-like [Cucumis melo var. makuwa]
MKKETSGPVLRPFPAGGRFQSQFSSPGTSPFAASTNFGFSSGSSTFLQNHDDHHHNHHRSASPTRVNISSTPLSRSVRFSIGHRSGSPKLSNRNSPVSLPKKPCMCSPTTHPGSFRCSLHKKSGSGIHQHQASSSAYSSTGLNMRRSAMTNSLVRIGGVEGDWVKRALTALIRPSSHQLRRRANFRPQPSRLSVMSKAE